MTSTQKSLIGIGVAGLALAVGLGLWSSGGWSEEKSSPDEGEQDADASEDSPRQRPDDAPPNVLVLLVDDAGYADFGIHGSEHFHTPRIDALASEGVRFTNGYVTAPICSPSRAGLLAGRYSQRFGHETNPPPSNAKDAGLPVGVATLADRMSARGYATAAIGKWHLGLAPHFHPNRRGFGYYWGFLKGERTYFEETTRGPHRIKRDRQLIDEDFDYLTDEIGEEAARWIGENAHEPFFLYVAYSAVHAPVEALDSDIRSQDPELKGKRRKLAAMTTALDRSIGVVLDALDDNDLAEDTLVVFLNDNGAGPKNGGDNLPFRAGKGSMYEGGVRVPFVIRWPGEIDPGSVYDLPVSALDIAPTALARSGPVPGGFDLDGVDLIPYLQGETTEAPHTALFWRLGDSWAIRDGDWKLLSQKGEEPELYNLATDPAESTNQVDNEGDRVASLRAHWDAWNALNIEPVFESNTDSRRRKKAEADSKR